MNPFELHKRPTLTHRSTEQIDLQEQYELDRELARYHHDIAWWKAATAKGGHPRSSITRGLGPVTILWRRETWFRVPNRFENACDQRRIPADEWKDCNYHPDLYGETP